MRRDSVGGDGHGAIRRFVLLLDTLFCSRLFCAYRHRKGTRLTRVASGGGADGTIDGQLRSFWALLRTNASVMENLLCTSIWTIFLSQTVLRPSPFWDSFPSGIGFFHQPPLVARVRLRSTGSSSSAEKGRQFIGGGPMFAEPDSSQGTHRNLNRTGRRYYHPSQSPPGPLGGDRMYSS